MTAITEIRKRHGVRFALCALLVLCAIVSTVIVANAQSDTATVLGFEQESPVVSVTVEPGTQQDALGLPETLRAQVERNGAKGVEEVPVTWSSGSYNPDIEGEYSFEAKPAGFAYDGELPFASIRVNADQSLDFGTGSQPSFDSSAETIANEGTSAQHNIHWIPGENYTLSEDGLRIDISPTTNKTQEVTLQIAASYGADFKAEVGEVTIRIPAHIFLNRDGSAIDTYEVPLPLAPQTGGVTKFHYSVDNKGTDSPNDDEIVITNYEPISGTTYFNSEITYRYDPTAVKNAYLNDSVQGHFEWPSSSGGTASSDNILTAVNHTDAKLLGLQKNPVYTYEKWESAWGPEPADAADYFYVAWKVDSTSTGIQPHTITFTDQTILGTIVGSNRNGFSGFPITDWADKNDILTVEVPGLTVGDLSAEANHKQSLYVLSKYPRANFKDGGRVDNSIKAELKGIDGAFDEKSASGTTYYSPPSETTEEVFKVTKGQAIQDTADITSYNSSLKSGLNRLEAGDPFTLMYNVETNSFHRSATQLGETIETVDEFSDGSVYVGGRDFVFTHFELIGFQQSVVSQSGGYTPIPAHDRDSFDVYIKMTDEPGTWVKYLTYKSEDSSFYYSNGDFAGTSATEFILPENCIGIKTLVESTNEHTFLSFNTNVKILPSEEVLKIIKNKNAHDFTNNVKGTVDVKTGTTYQSLDYQRDTLGRIKVETGYYKKAGMPVKDDINSIVKIPVQIYINEKLDGFDTTLPINSEKYGTVLNPLSAGDLFDLLPAGVFLEDITVTSYTDKNEMKNISWDVEYVPNWRDSGRTMMIVHIEGEPDPSVYDQYRTHGYWLNYTMVSTYENLVDNGARMKNLSSWLSGSGELSGRGSFWTDKEEARLMYDLNGDGQFEKTNVEVINSYASTTVPGPFAVQAGYSKLVANSTGDYSKDSAVVDPDETYSYKLRYQTQPSTRASNMIMYDVLENAHGDNKYWQGTLQGVNTFMAEGKGAKVDVYYSTVPGISPYDSRGSTDQGDVSNTDYWSLTPPDDLSTVTALAFDLRHTPDGGDFILSGSSSVYVEIFMKAPSEGATAATIHEKAYNSSGCTVTNTAITGSSSTSTEGSNTVTVSKTPPTLFAWSFTKVDAENTSTVLPGAEFDLYAWSGEGEPGADALVTDASGGWTKHASATSGEDGAVSFDNLPAGTYQLVETKAPGGYTAPSGQWRVVVDPSAAQLIDIKAVAAGGHMPPAFMTADGGLFKLPNMKTSDLPVSGGPGTAFFALAGVVVAGAASVLAMSARRTRKNTGGYALK